MSWLGITLIAYFLLAVANLFDKFLVDNVIKNSRAYTFVACIFGLFSWLVSPWFLQWPGALLLFINLFNGAVFALALCLLYEALRRGEASRVLVFVGGMTPVFSLFFSYFLFGERFSFSQYWGLGVILFGIFLVASLPVARNYLARILNKFSFGQDLRHGGLLIATGSALAYSIYFVGTKWAYASQPFASAFLWNRLGAVFLVVFFLFNSGNRTAIKALFYKSSPRKNKFLVAFNQVLGSLGFALQNYAVSLGSVVMVNALQGTQYAFLLIISAILASLAPKLLKESFSLRIFLQKVSAVILIAIGLYLLVF